MNDELLEAKLNEISKSVERLETAMNRLSSGGLATIAWIAMIAGLLVAEISPNDSKTIVGLEVVGWSVMICSVWSILEKRRKSKKSSP